MNACQEIDTDQRQVLYDAWQKKPCQLMAHRVGDHLINPPERVNVTK